MEKKLAVFDFDGTITNKDTMLAFIAYAKGGFQLYLSMFLLSPFLILMKLGLFSNAKAKAMLLKYHFAGKEQEWFDRKARDFARDIIPRYLREKAIGQISYHRGSGHDLIVITASLDLWVKPWFDHHKLDFISTKGEMKDGLFTGKLDGPNISGQEKVKQLKSRFNLKDYDRIYAYGDSRGDREILKLADRAYWKPFRKRISTKPID